MLTIRVAAVLSEIECSKIAAAVTNSPQFRFQGKGFCGIGPGGFDLPGKADDYFGWAQEVQNILAGPYAAVDQVFGGLERPLYSLDKPMRPLTARRYTSEFIALPHQDNDLSIYPWAGTQLGISLTLVSPKQGGAIRLWDLAYSPDQYAERTLPGRTELDESKIPPHDLEVFGKVGELVIINARKVHAIDPIVDGVRISVSGFLAVDDSRVWIWS
jgi:hypothetical protein